VQGRNTEMCSLGGSRAARSALGASDRNTSDHMPGAGNYTNPTLRNAEPDLENSVSKICLRLL